MYAMKINNVIFVGKTSDQTIPPAILFLCELGLTIHHSLRVPRHTCRQLCTIIDKKLFIV